MEEDFKFQKGARDPSHNWIEQKKKKRQREKKEKKWNQDGTSTSERSCERGKGIHTLGDHLTDREISQDGGGSLKSQRKVQQLD